MATTLLSYIVIVLFCTHVSSFNIEYRNPIVKREKKGSYFGYSVAEHKSSESGHLNDSWILVGAPLGQNLQPSTSMSGALFKCSIAERNDRNCIQVETDGRRLVGGLYMSNDFDYDEDEDDEVMLRPPGDDEIKHGQWLGVNVRSQGPGGKVMVCAHRYITGNLTSVQHGLGLCYSLNNDLEWEEQYEPCKGRPMIREHQEFGFCQAGTSLAVLSDGTALIGSPGPYTWRGTMFVRSIVGNFLDKDSNYYLGPLNDNSEPIEKYSYLGMSVTAGRFMRKNLTSYAAGAPRSKLHGQVYIFDKLTSDKPMNISLIISGEQVTSNFGYEIISTDINKDGYDDLIVAAPFYFTRTEGGAVYIYYEVRNCNATECKNQTLYGLPESRFGFAMTALGDINKDGFPDLAIGAPYEGNGAIYIYLGSQNGIIPKYSQKLHPEAEGATTIGYSLSGGIDMDNNGYPDLLTGAYESDMAILFLTRPIIDIEIDISGEELKNINNSRSGCKSDARSNNTCFSFKSCFTIKPLELKTNLENVRVKSSVIAETFEKKFSRVWFKKNITDVIHSYIDRYFTLNQRDTRYCQHETVYIKESTVDILTPIKFRVNYTLANNDIDSPILNQTSVKVFEATFQKDCGNDDRCQSYLVLNSTLLQLKNVSQDEYQLNLKKSNEIYLQINVTNKGDPAYEAELHINYSKALDYVALEDKLSNIGCTGKNDSTLVCSLGNPFGRYKFVSLVLRLESNDLIHKEDRLEFNISVKSTSEELSHQTSSHFYAVIKKRAEVRIHGNTNPAHVKFGGEVKGESAMEYFEDIGKRIIHTYHVFNDGPLYVEGLQVVIHWPWQVANDKPQGKWLLYLESMPYIEGKDNGECIVEPSYAVNLLNLTNKAGVAEQPLENLSMPPPDFNDIGYNFTPSPLPSLTRRKRDTEFVVKPRTVTSSDGRKRKVVTMDCVRGTVMDTAKCIRIICTVIKLDTNTEVTIRVKSRIWNSTLVEDYNQIDWVKITSLGEIVLPDPTIEQSPVDDRFEVSTIAYPEIHQEDGGISIWVYIGAALAGLLLLVLLTALLWKLGFFKRNRVNDPIATGKVEKSENETLLQ